MAVYWIGADNNIWYKGDDGNVVNRGSANDFYPGGGLLDQGASGHRSGSFQATRIADPNPPQQPASAAPSGGGSSGGGGSAFPALNVGAITNTQQTIDQIPGILQAALEAEAQRYRNTVGGFDVQEQTQRQNYDRSSVTNQQNYDQNYMDSIRAGIKGLGGLMALLRGTGASGGTADQDVRDIVGGVTSNDIRTGADTRNENQAALDNSLSTFLTEIGLKRKQSEDTRVNNERAIRRDSDSQLQDLFGKLAGYYGDAGRTAERDAWMSRAGALTPGIAANTRTQVSNYDQTPVSVQAPQLNDFKDPTEPSVVVSPSDNQIGSGIFAISNRRKEERKTNPLLTPSGV